MQKIDRKEHLEEIFIELRKLANKDMRIGQIFNILHDKIENNYSDMFNIENDHILKELIELNA